MPLAPLQNSSEGSDASKTHEDWTDVQSQDKKDEIIPAVQRMFSECDKGVEHRSTTFSVCLTLIEHLSIDQPTALRHARANKLYKLADTLAATKTPR